MRDKEHQEEQWTSLFKGKKGPEGKDEEERQEKKIVGQQSVIKNYTIYYVIH